MSVTFENLDEESLFYLRGYLRGIQVKFIYKGHPVKVKIKVTAAKKREIPYSAI